MITLSLVAMVGLLVIGAGFFVHATYLAPRAIQERVWRSVATELGAEVKDNGFFFGLALRAPVGDAVVIVTRSNIGAVDVAAGKEVGPLFTDNSIRTYVSAMALPGGPPSGPCFVTRDGRRALLGNDLAVVSEALDGLAPLLSRVRPAIEHLVVGPRRVDMKLNVNAVADAALLAGAIELVGRLAGGAPSTRSAARAPSHRALAPT